MKILKFEDNTSYLYVDGKYKKILEISKDDILKALEYIYENDDIEIEEYDKNKIVNEAEKIVYENPVQVKSGKRPDGEKKHIRFVTGKKRSTGKGNIPIPVVYLGLSRLYPIGEVDDLKENNLELSDQEIVFF